jgi:hypothetical protein
MRYERRKEITAALSIISVFIALMAVFFTKTLIGDFSRSLVLITGFAAMVAALAAVMSIMISQRLAKEREKRRVFIIYAREDLEAARNLSANLRELGFNPWLDVDEISPGQVWRKSVINALEKSSMALVLISKNLSKKGFVQEELKVAMGILQEREKDISPVIPVRLDESEVPESLSHIHWVNLFEENGIDRLVKGLSIIAEGKHSA